MKYLVLGGADEDPNANLFRVYTFAYHLIYHQQEGNKNDETPGIERCP